MLIAASRAHRLLWVVHDELGQGAILRIIGRVARLVMKKKSTKTTAEPSKASLREIPEADLAHARVLGRGRRVAKAKRSFETILIDKKVLETLGGPEALMGILVALANSIEASRNRESLTKRARVRASTRKMMAIHDETLRKLSK